MAIDAASSISKPKFSPLKNTEHFMLLVGAIDVVVLAIILLLAKNPTVCAGDVCYKENRLMIETAASRMAALMYLTSAAISLYVGIISFKYHRKFRWPFLLPIILVAIAALFNAVA